MDYQPFFKHQLQSMLTAATNNNNNIQSGRVDRCTTYYVLHMNSGYVTGFSGSTNDTTADAAANGSSKENEVLVEESSKHSKWAASSRMGRRHHRVRKPYESSWRKRMGDRV